MTIVSRFAPSPTGFLHIGGARTALFSWLLARHAGGKFLLRIEDTDRERSTQAAVDAILEAMDWLGLEYDGEALYQSHREARHNEVIDELVARGQAYWCECTADEVEAMRERARAAGRKPKYDGRCRERGLGPGEGRVVRLKAPLTGTIAYRDMVKGPIAVEAEELDDMILRRSDGTPTYNLAVVVDDHDMGVNHVLRGDDHVNNTPRQILLYRAMGWETPEFGHVPMILGPDKKKLSKRHGALSVMEYRDMGYLPEAVVNYLARLGWSHGDQEVFSREELVALFDTANLGSSPSVFDTQKLDWLNGQYLQKADPAAVLTQLTPILEQQWGAERLAAADMGRVAAAVPLLLPRAKNLVEMAPQLEPFARGAAELEYDAAAVAKILTPEARALLAEYRAVLAGAAEFAEGPLEAAAKEFLEARGLKFKALAQPIRVAVTGRTASPGLFETVQALGREETLARLDRALTLP
ncbi:MAG: glutamate--tRNA ligase [Desulfovibrionaceae bacterium]